ncbi:MAG: hypothetical protein AB1394_15365 [Bacteroidota bacterium]
MNESLVQWVLLKRPEYLGDRLGFKLKKKLGENYTTKQGRIDFAFETEKEVLEELSKTTGVYLGPPVAMDVTHLRWLNKIIKPFCDEQVDSLQFDVLRNTFNSRTNFDVYKSLAQYFELIRIEKDKLVCLTCYGKRFRDNYNAHIIQSNATMPDLSLEQKRILLEILTNGIFTKSKVNIYYFLRFVHLTNGNWLPKLGAPEDAEKLKFVNFLFDKSYKWSTLKELLLFTCNQCEELELVEE